MCVTQLEKSEYRLATDDIKELLLISFRCDHGGVIVVLKETLPFRDTMKCRRRTKLAHNLKSHKNPECFADFSTHMNACLQKI